MAKTEEYDIEEAIQIFGGASNLASILGISRKTIYNWIDDGRYTIEWCNGDLTEDKFCDHLIVSKEILISGIFNKAELKSGYVYCVSNGDKMKIGRTSNPTQRIKTIKSSVIKNATRVYVSKPQSDCHALERAALNNFKDYLIDGEVFSCCFEDAVKFIEDNLRPINIGARLKGVDPNFIIKNIEDGFKK